MIVIGFKLDCILQKINAAFLKDKSGLRIYFFSMLSMLLKAWMRQEWARNGVETKHEDS